MRVETRIRAAIALVLTCMSAVAAQEPAVFRASTDVVLVPVSVTDQNGRFVHGLTSDHFEISEGGTRRAVKQFTADRVPVSLGILLDISGSMTEDPKIRADERARWADMRRALALLLTRLDAADEVFFAVFNERVAAASWTQDHLALLREFDALRSRGGNALLDAVPAILPTFELGRYQRKVLLLITDGNDAHVPTPSLMLSYPTSDIAPPGHEPLTIMGDSRESVRQRRISTTKSAVRRSDVTVYAIGIGRRKGEPADTVLLEGLTTESGGYVEPLRDPTEIPAAIARICDDLQSQYLLAFAPGQADGKYHSIQVRTKDRRLRVRAPLATWRCPRQPSKRPVAPGTVSLRCELGLALLSGNFERPLDICAFCLVHGQLRDTHGIPTPCYRVPSPARTGSRRPTDLYDSIVSSADYQTLRD